MTHIWKYPIPADGEILMDEDAEIIHAGYDPNTSVCIWALIDTGRLQSKRKFAVLPTGAEIPDDPPSYHVGTFREGPFVFHVFELLDY